MFAGDDFVQTSESKLAGPSPTCEQLSGNQKVRQLLLIADRHAVAGVQNEARRAVVASKLNRRSASEEMKIARTDCHTERLRSGPVAPALGVNHRDHVASCASNSKRRGSDNYFL